MVSESSDTYAKFDDGCRAVRAGAVGVGAVALGTA